MTDLAIMTECALHIANGVIRADQRGDREAADRAHIRFHELITNFDPDNSLLLAVTRRLGRVRAKAVAIEDEVIELACRTGYKQHQGHTTDVA